VCIHYFDKTFIYAETTPMKTLQHVDGMARARRREADEHHHTEKTGLRGARERTSSPMGEMEKLGRCVELPLFCDYFSFVRKQKQKFSVSDVWRERKEMKAASFRMKAGAMAA
jgi:hypothetical protein